MRLSAGVVLAALLASLVHALAQEPKKPPAPVAIQKEFNDFLAKFRAALEANDPAAVARMARLPFESDDSVRDAAQFRAKIYLPEFTAKNGSCLQREKAVYDRDSENNNNYFISCGELLFVFTKAPAGFLLTDIQAND
jgi:hypothetical protein